MTKDLEVNLMGMTPEEACQLATMIRGAGLVERRTFNTVLRQLHEEGVINVQHEKRIHLKL